MWTLAPAVLLLVIAVPTLATIFDLAEEPKDAVVINVIGQQWWWEFQYPNIDGKGTTVVTANDMVIPAGVNVKLNITDRDVIHSFWLPRLNGKRDGAEPYSPAQHQGRRTRRVLGAVRRVLRPFPRQHAHPVDRLVRGRLGQVGRQPDQAGGRTEQRIRQSGPERLLGAVRAVPPDQRCEPGPERAARGAAPNLTAHS